MKSFRQHQVSWPIIGEQEKRYESSDPSNAKVKSNDSLKTKLRTKDWELKTKTGENNRYLRRLSMMRFFQESKSSGEKRLRKDKVTV